MQPLHLFKIIHERAVAWGLLTGSFYYQTDNPSQVKHFEVYQLPNF